MATVVHGACSSPRQHQCELTPGTATSNICMTANHQQTHHASHQHQQHQATTPIYASINKYLRPGTASQLNSHHHPHIYDGNSSNNTPGQLQYGTPLNQISYISMAPVAVTHTSPPLQHGYGTSQLASAAPVVASPGDNCRNYWTQTHAATMTYSGSGMVGLANARHNTKRKSAVQLLAETKPFYMKGDTAGGLMERLQTMASPSPSPAYRKAFLPNSSLKRGRSSASASARDQVKYGSTYGMSGVPVIHSSGDVERRYLPRPPLSGRDAATVALHTSHGHHHRHHNPHNGQINRHSAPAYSNNLMQGKLKVLLTPETMRERISVGTQHAPELSRKFSDFSENINPDTSLPYLHKNEMMTLPPPMFLSTQSFEDSYSYAAGETSSIDEPLVLTDDYRPISPPAEYAAEITHTNAETRARYNYQRSYSHSHEMTGQRTNDTDIYNINSHKSLPDLHSQISRHSPHSEILSCCSRGNRSIKSAGESSLNRDSGGSSGHYTHRSEPCYRQRDPDINCVDNYEASKAPVCCNHAGNAATAEFRRDSGSSTQHSANSYCGYASPISYGRGTDCMTCRCNRNSVPYDSTCDYFLNFPTPVVPEAFQDDYTPPSPSVPPPQMQQAQHRIKLNDPSPPPPPPPHSRYYSSSNAELPMRQQAHQQQQQQQQHHQQQLMPAGPSVMRLSHNPTTAQSPGSTPSIEDISPPPIQFKRQKCIRLKNRARLSMPNATSLCNSSSAVQGNNVPGNIGGNSIISYNRMEPQTFLFPKCITTTSIDEHNRLKCYGSSGGSRRPSCEKITTTPPMSAMSPGNSSIGLSVMEMDQAYQAQLHHSDSLNDLEHFFDRLGLNDEKFEEIYAAPRRRHSTSATADSDDSSTVFFSDVSTVDSMRLPDSTETQPQTTQPYRPSEPPSIVERNARIIKWLCNIRKLEHK